MFSGESQNEHSKRLLLSEMNERSGRKLISRLGLSQMKSWFLNQVDPKNLNYNVPVHIKFTGKLNIEKLYRSLEIMYNKHEPLRLRIISTSQGPLQILKDVGTLECETISLMHLSPSKKALALEDLLEKYIAHVFNFEIESPIQFKLVKVSDEINYLFILGHQVVLDGVGFRLFLPELAEINFRLNADKDVSTEAAQVGYLEFMAKQLNWRNEADYKKSLEYWRNKLGENCKRTQFRVPKQPVKKYFFEVHIEQSKYSVVANFCEKAGASQYVYLTTCLKIALARMVEQDDICIGTMVNTRGHFDLDAWKTLGEFTNRVGLRSSVRLKELFSSYLALMVKTIGEAQAHAKCAIEDVVKMIHPQWSDARNPFFNVNFVMHNIPDRELQFQSDVRAEIFSPETPNIGIFPLWDIIIHGHIRETGLHITFKTNPQVVDDVEMERFLAMFQFLVENGPTLSEETIEELVRLSQISLSAA